ncbi:secreted antigen 1 [Babesia caballi]|uniref:Secreted antigen 1 n=1 Tax=Babesia caballi TaxID=5871 RepID=A0AAV4LUG9_BABCB|nr:secreted antigen 1 [Babesia caballi]
MTTCPSASAPKSLKDALDLLGALNNNSGGLKGLVGKELERRVSEYSNNIAVESHLKGVLDNLTKLRQQLDNDFWTHGSYNEVQNKSPNCLAYTVTDCFPTLYCTLCYLNFNVNGESQGGGVWACQQCNSGNLQNWLKGNKEIPSASGPSSQAKLWSGGFSGVLKCSQASEFSSQLQNCVDSRHDKFPMLLSGILFLKPSVPELTSTFLVFVSAICIIVCNERQEEGREEESRKKLHAAFEKQYKSFSEYSSFKSCCKTVKNNIETLIGKGPSGDDGALHIPQNSRMMYLQQLHSDKFPLYLTWLSQNLESFIKNLKQMHTDCTSWDSQKMSEGQVAGPFPYGFGFPKIESWKTQAVKSSLQKLTDANTNDGLPALQSYVENLIASSTSSAAGTIAGSLIGTAAVGGMGTAVALNVGGVTTALKGAVGILK